MLGSDTREGRDVMLLVSAPTCKQRMEGCEATHSHLGHYGRSSNIVRIGSDSRHAGAAVHVPRQDRAVVGEASRTSSKGRQCANGDDQGTAANDGSRAFDPGSSGSRFDGLPRHASVQRLGDHQARVLHDARPGSREESHIVSLGSLPIPGQHLDVHALWKGWFLDLEPLRSIPRRRMDALRWQTGRVGDTSLLGVTPSTTTTKRER
jgi:hypothetical protein